jgi:predicted ester cyclase
MDTMDAQRLITRLFAEVIDGHDYTRIGELLDPDCLDHGPLGETRGHEPFIGMLSVFRAALPDYRHDVLDVMVLDDATAVWLVHVRATFSGEMNGVAGAGQPVDLWVANAARFADGPIVEHWGLGPDGMSTMLAQMGLAPEPASA